VNHVEELNINCPYCTELISILVECLVSDQSYTEDCYVCCRPIELILKISQEGDIFFEARREND
jgi:hypothetical protein